VDFFFFFGTSVFGFSALSLSSKDWFFIFFSFLLMKPQSIKNAILVFMAFFSPFCKFGSFLFKLLPCHVDLYYPPFKFSCNGLFALLFMIFFVPFLPLIGLNTLFFSIEGNFVLLFLFRPGLSFLIVKHKDPLPPLHFPPFSFFYTVRSPFFSPTGTLVSMPLPLSFPLLSFLISAVG